MATKAKQAAKVATVLRLIDCEAKRRDERVRLARAILSLLLGRAEAGEDMRLIVYVDGGPHSYGEIGSNAAGAEERTAMLARATVSVQSGLFPE